MESGAFINGLISASTSDAAFLKELYGRPGNSVAKGPEAVGQWVYVRLTKENTGKPTDILTKAQWMKGREGSWKGIAQAVGRAEDANEMTLDDFVNGIMKLYVISSTPHVDPIGLPFRRGPNSSGRPGTRSAAPGPSNSPVTSPPKQ
jgi:hypothetical protein